VGVADTISGGPFSETRFFLHLSLDDSNDPFYVSACSPKAINLHLEASMYEVGCQSGKPVVSALDTARNTGAAVSLALDVSTSGICGVHGYPSEFKFLLGSAR